MAYADSLKSGVDILSFKWASAVKLSKERDATAHGFITLVLVGVVTGLLTNAFSFGRITLMGIIAAPIGMIISFLIGFIIVHALAKLFGGKAGLEEFFRPLSNAAIAYPLTAIPFLGFLVGLYYIVIDAFIIKEVHQLPWSKVILIFVILFVIAVIIGLVIAVILGSIFYALMGGSVLSQLA